MIDPATVQKIIDSANIVEVVSDFVNLRKRGVSYVGLCPFHADRNPSFYVSPSKNICKCFSCGEGGTPVHFVMKHEQLSYAEALKYLARKYNIAVEEREQTDEEKQLANERESLFIVNEYAREFFTDCLLHSEEGIDIGLSYFRERGLRNETIKRFGLGYSPESRSTLTDAAIQKGYQMKYLVDSGVTLQFEDNRPPVDRFRGRVIFPVYTVSGKTVAFGGRILVKKEKVGKYVNSPENAIYSKSRELYGLYQAKRAIVKENKCFMVEGYMDVLSMYQSGVENVVASSGTALTVQQIRLLHRFTDNITVLYDGDAAGIKAALRGIDLLLEEGMHIKVVLLPDGEDPDSFARSHSAEEFRRYINDAEDDFIHFKISLLLDETANDPIRRAGVISDIVRSISLIPDAIERAVYVQTTSQRLNMDEQLLLGEVKKAQRGHRASSSSYNQSSTPIAASGTPSVEEDSIENEVKSASMPDKCEWELLKQIIRHGNELVRLVENDEEFTIELSRLAGEELDEDGLRFGSLIMQKILDEAVGVCLAERKDTIQYFTNHPDSDISRLAVELSADRYQLSKVYDRMESKVGETEDFIRKNQIRRGSLVIREIYNIKNNYIIESLRKIQNEMIKVQRDGDNDAILHLMQQMAELNEMKCRFAQALGERTVI